MSERGDVSGFSLNELAREAGMAKSNVYRYFESRESLLLEVLEEQWQKWFLEFDREVPKARPLSLEQLCETLCRSIASRPLLCTLMSALPTVLEHNASIETIREFKVRSVDSLHRLGQYCHESCAELSSQEFESLLHLMIVTMTGLWPYSHPCEAVEAALEDSRLSRFKRDFPADLTASVTLLAKGMIASRP